MAVYMHVTDSCTCDYRTCGCISICDCISICACDCIVHVAVYVHVTIIQLTIYVCTCDCIIHVATCSYIIIHVMDYCIDTCSLLSFQVETRSILVFFPTSETQPLSSPEFNHKLMRKFPILTQLAPPSPLTNSSSSCSISSCLIVSLPCILLESAKSHVLDEPVPRHSRVDTLPWDCSLSDMAVFTNINHKIHSVLDPLVVKTTLASQQEGIGVTVHSDTVALSLSKKQV